MITLSCLGMALSWAADWDGAGAEEKTEVLYSCEGCSWSCEESRLNWGGGRWRDEGADEPCGGTSEGSCPPL